MKSLERLRSVPWRELEGHHEGLAAALDGVLAGAAADKTLERLLKQHRAATPALRTALAEAVFGVGLWRRRLRAGAPTGSGLELLHRLIDGHPEPEGFADCFSLPDWLAETIQRERAEGAADFADALNLPGPICLRANTLSGPRDALSLALAAQGIEVREGRWAPDCLVVTSPRPNLYPLQAQTPVPFEVQDEGSQLLGQLVGARPGDVVLDLCAGAGGKTLQLAAALGNRGTVHASDVDLKRLERLRTRAAQAGATCVAIHGQTVPPELRANRVLVDAPCSELGALRRGPDLRWRLDPSAFGAFPALQRGLLERALRHLAPGGRLVYATCTFRREENEEVIRAFERDHPELERKRPEVDPALLDGEGFFRAWPDLHGSDAFFAAVHQLS